MRARQLIQRYSNERSRIASLTGNALVCLNVRIRINDLYVVFSNVSIMKALPIACEHQELLQASFTASGG
jgi:hypothetical protein